jgi:serine phosphatase RsbU (regulator of sigma subunit)
VLGKDAAARRAQSAPEAFQRYLDGLIHRWMETVAAIGFTLVPVFLLLDYFTVPRELWGRFLLYRGLSTAFCIALFFVLRRTRPSHWSILWGHITVAVVGGTIAAMTVDLGGFDSRYYAGLNLVIVAVNLFLPWRPAQSALNGTLIIGIYVILNALFGGPFEIRNMVGNLFFMSSIVVIAVAVTYVRHELIRKEFDLRSELLDSNALLESSRADLKKARDALWGEMEVAKRIQTALLPYDRKAGPYEVAAAMFPAAEVGGDYYDIITPPGGRSWVAVGDVSGHGVESGLVMMMTQTAILSLVRQDPGRAPAGVFQAVNGVIFENVSRLGSIRYMTLNVVRLDDEGLTLAGKHQDVLVWRSAGRRVETFANDGCWIGVVPEVGACAQDAFLPLGPGDVALFFTDGVTEARNEAGELFGEERLAAAFARVAEGPSADAIQSILDEVAYFTRAQSDDMTLLLVRRLRA